MENIGTIISFLVGVVALLTMLVWFGRFIQRVKVHDKKLDDVSDELKTISPMVSLHDKKMDELSVDVNEVKRIVPIVYMHDKKLDSMVEGISQLKEAMASMRSVLLMKFKDLEPALSGKHSPRTLTEQGLKIFRDMKGEEFLKKM